MRMTYHQVRESCLDGGLETMNANSVEGQVDSARLRITSQ